MVAFSTMCVVNGRSIFEANVGSAGALFVVASAEAVPAALNSFADVLTVQLPRGSLLLGLLEADPAIVPDWQSPALSAAY